MNAALMSVPIVLLPPGAGSSGEPERAATVGSQSADMTGTRPTIYYESARIEMKNRKKYAEIAEDRGCSSRSADETRPAGMWPTQRAISGIRIPPS